MVNSPFSCPPLPTRPELRQSQSTTWGWPRFIDNKHPLAEQAGLSVTPAYRGAPNPIRTSSLPIRRAEDSTEFETASQHSVADSQKSHISVTSSSVSSDCRKAGLLEDTGVLMVPLQPVEPSPKAKDRSHSGLFRGEDDDCDSERRRRSLSTITDAPSVAASESGMDGPNLEDSSVSQDVNPRPRLYAGHDTEAILASVQAMPGGFEPKAGRSSTPDMPNIAGPTEDEISRTRRSTNTDGHVVADDHVTADGHVVTDAAEVPISDFNSGPCISSLHEPMSMTQPTDNTVGPTAHHLGDDDHTLLDHYQGTRNDQSFLDHMRETPHSGEEESHVLPVPETSTLAELIDRACGEPVSKQGDPDKFINELEEIMAAAPLVKAKETPQITETANSACALDNPTVQPRDTVELPKASIPAQDRVKFAGESDNTHGDKPVHAEHSVLEGIAPDAPLTSKAPQANRKRSNGNLPPPKSISVPRIVVQQPSETESEQPERTSDASCLQAMPPAPDDSSEVDAACLPRIKRHALYLRRARNLTVREIMLKAMLGRELGKQTKDSLRTLAQGESL